MINAYYPRCKESDYPEMVKLAQLLGIINIISVDGIERICDNPPNNWDYRGQLWEGTGVFTEVDGQQVETQRLIVADDGQPYIHVNVLCRFDLGERARELAIAHPEIAEALGNLGKFFLLDADGKIRPPKNPQCTF